MKKAVLYFIASVLLTAVFSCSLKVFVKENFTVLTLKTMLIPCFTWVILLGSALSFLRGKNRLNYFIIAGRACMRGSAALVPAGVYNFISAVPFPAVSMISVFACVVLMSITFYYNLQKENISLNWWWGFNVLICINMGLFWFSIR